MVESHSSNFRVITKNFWGVPIFRKFMVYVWYKIDFSKISENCYSLLKTWFFTPPPPQRNVFHFPFIAGSVLKNNFKYWRWFSLQIDAGSVYNFLNIYIAWCLANEPRNDKTNKMSVCPEKTQISLGISPVWSESSLSAWRKLGSLATHWAHSKDSDQTGRMPRLIWVFAGLTLILLFCHETAQMFSSIQKINVVWMKLPKENSYKWTLKIHYEEIDFHESMIQLLVIMIGCCVKSIWAWLFDWQLSLNGSLFCMCRCFVGVPYRWTWRGTGVGQISAEEAEIPWWERGRQRSGRKSARGSVEFTQHSSCCKTLHIVHLAYLK